MMVPQQSKNRTTMWSSNPTSGFPKEMKVGTRTNISYIHVHSSIIHNNQNMEATQMFNSEWMDKRNVVYTYSGTFFSLTKNGNPVTCYNMDEPWGHYAKWNKQVTEGQILHDSTSMRCLK